MKKTEIKKPKPTVYTRREGFAPMLFAAASATIALIAAVIDKFIFPFGQEPLSPLIAQILILLIPAYILIALMLPQKSLAEQMKEMGIRRLRAEYIFFVIFAAFFAITTSLILNMIFGGLHSAAKGFTVLGAFRAGDNDYSVSPLYLIITYAFIPAFIEELAFRGFVFIQAKKVSVPVACLLSSAIYALFFFSPAQIPAALVGGLILSLVLATTDSLVACMLVHFIYNLFALFWQTNFSQYFITANQKLLPVVIVAAAWLLACVLFFTEAARIYKARADKKDQSTLDADASKPFSFKALWGDIKAIFAYKPTLISLIVFAMIYIAISVVAF